MKKLIYLLFFIPGLLLAQTSTENYVLSKTYKIPVQSNQLSTVSSANVDKVVQYLDGLGRAKQTHAIASGGENAKNLLVYDWTVNATATPFYNRNGSSSENNIITGLSPDGHTDLLWECIPDAASNGDGGWNTDYFTVDTNKTYQYSVWVKRTGSQAGKTYHGVNNVNNLSGSENTNPYFWSGDLPQLDTWYLMVGVVHPSGYSGGDTGVSGVYDISGNKVLDGTEYKWRTTTSSIRVRNYLYYTTDTSVRQYFYKPTFVMMEETSPAKDLVTHYEYDGYGRQLKEYLPYAVNSDNGLIETGDVALATKNFYKSKYANDFSGVSAVNTNPYSEKRIESSPLGRIYEQAAPGKSWAMGSSLISGKEYSNGHTIKFEYNGNTTNEVRLYYVSTSFANNTYTPTLQGGTSYYTAGELTKIITKDENWISSDGVNHTTEEFKNKQGQVILKRTYSSSVAHDTYYVYDDFGNLTYVLPPKSEPQSAKPTTTELNELCYQYVYDYRNRLVEKKIPGKGWEYIIYDTLDRPVMTQDANQRAQSPDQWLFTKYDALGRVVYTGFYYSNSSRTNRQASINSFLLNRPDRLYEEITGENTINGTTYYYTNKAYPNSSTNDVLTINYYDTYTDLPSGYNPPTSVYGNAVSDNTKGLSTVTKTRVLGTSNWITTLTYYDEKNRPIYSYIKNDLHNTRDVVQSKLDFTGKVLETKTTHKKTGKSDIITYDLFEYDNKGRLLSQKQRIKGELQQTIVGNTYDDLGQLVSKKVGGKTTQSSLQDIDYAYNVRGWLQNINQDAKSDNDLFNFSLRYDSPTSGTALYNGNISQTSWNTLNVDSSVKTYTYNYDALNRITSALGNTSNYNLNSVTYDKNGNITALSRNGHLNSGATSFGLMDNLSYAYYPNTNQLKSVNDSSNESYGFKELANTATEYTYDANGNMITDANKGITNITYSHLNLPTQVIINGQNITYTYDAVGTKLSKVVSGTTTDYAGNYIYENNVLKQITQPEGYIEPDGNSFQYVYQYRDIWDNVRLTYSDDNNDGAITASTEIRREQNYYPFGLQHKGYNNVVNGTENNYQTFQGQEEEKELGKNTYAFQWRDYDPAIARFNKIDRFSEKYAGISPYAFSANNPIRYREVAGDSIKIAVITRGANNEAVTQNLYWGQDANGNNGFIDIATGNAYQGNDQLVANVTGALNNLINGGNAGSTLVNDLASDQNNSVQIIGTNGGNGADENNGNWVRWNSTNVNGPPDNDPNNNNQRPSYIGLGHELAHVRDVWNGGADQTAWYNYTDANGNNQSIPRAEIYATHIENQLRGENNLPLRTNYSVDPNGNPTGPNILFPGTRQSRYYDSNGNNNVNYRTIRRRRQTPFSY